MPGMTSLPKTVYTVDQLMTQWGFAQDLRLKYWQMAYPSANPDTNSSNSEHWLGIDIAVRDPFNTHITVSRESFGGYCHKQHSQHSAIDDWLLENTGPYSIRHSKELNTVSTIMRGGRMTSATVLTHEVVSLLQVWMPREIGWFHTRVAELIADRI